MLVIGNNNIKPHIHATHSQSLKDDSTSSKLGRTTLFTFLYFLFFSCVTNIYTKDNEVISCFPQPAWDLAYKFSKRLDIFIPINDHGSMNGEFKST